VSNQSAAGCVSTRCTILWAATGALAVINCGSLTSAVIAGSTASTRLTSFALMLPVNRPGVDEVLDQRAKDIWRGSKGQPRKGDEMFFNLALSLRRAGMGLCEIESTLRSEAQFGRSPRQRSSQLPSIMSSLRRYSVSVS
jgi:hypothetical protein